MVLTTSNATYITNPNPNGEDSERLFLNSVSSVYTRNQYKVHLQKYLEICGYKDLSELLSKDHIQIENELIHFIISCKEKGMKHAAIMNYVKPIVTLAKISDIMVNTKKVCRFMPPELRNRKTSGYSQSQLQKLLAIADERLTAVILLASSSGQRIGSIARLEMSSLEPIGDLFKITCYEGEPEEYTTFCSGEARRALENYFSARRIHGEPMDREGKTSKTPVIREQYDKRDQFAVAHPKHVKETAIARKLIELAETAGVRTHIQLKEGERSSSVRSAIPVCNGFRRYFCKTLLDSGLQTEKRWLLEGHNLKGQDSSYLKISTGDLLSQYLLAHDNLLVSQEHILKEKVQKMEIERSEIQALALELERIKKATGID
jgi:integrase